MTNEDKEKLEVLQFIGGTIGALKELDSKIISKTNPFTKITGINVNKVQEDLKGTSFNTPQQQIPVANQSIPVQQEYIQQNVPPSIDSNQLELPFDKKYDLNDIFDKVNTVYQKIIALESQVKSLEDTILKKS